MSPARQHRDRLAALALDADPSAPVASSEGGGQPGETIIAVIDAPMTPARQHRLRLAGIAAAAADAETAIGSDAPAAPGTVASLGTVAAFAAKQAHGQIVLRLTHDLRRLKEIQSIERKVDAKREMLPEYRPWISGLLRAAEETGMGVQDEVLPTIMVWAIDTGEWVYGLDLARYVLEHDLALPARYERQPATLIVEEFADAAIAVLERDELFPHDVLSELYELTRGEDMPDEVRAKLHKAIGLDYLAVLNPALYPEATDEHRDDSRAEAIKHFARAIQLNSRIGLKQKLDKLKKDAPSSPPALDTPPTP
ncbi:phage terminase small subunit [Sphingomonas sp. NFR15]|uniref:phage terminase small subunit n=1 Tax=Sphingomonas sp. NFR15 TaxID=1566282 RepID=UPI000886FA65|nr:phage terminase small subunit [Sphingomonas sp. NFR15]SDA21504.1 Phage small terminase subunit [Sphingomonas sp. NFR15]